MKLGLAIDDVQDAEMELAKQLVALAERHHSDADVYHMCLARAHACAEHVWRLRPFVATYGARETDVDDATAPGLLEKLQRGTSTLLGRSPEAGLLLLQDLRDTYPAAHRAEIGWIVLRQAAKAGRDAELVQVVEECAAEAEQTWKWLRTRIKDSAAQPLARS